MFLMDATYIHIMYNGRAVIYLVVVALLFVLQLVGSLSSSIFAFMFTLLQVRVQVIVLHLHLSGPRLDLRHLRGRIHMFYSEKTVISYMMTRRLLSCLIWIVASFLSNAVLLSLSFVVHCGKKKKKILDGTLYNRCARDYLTVGQVAVHVMSGSLCANRISIGMFLLLCNITQLFTFALTP